MAEVQTFEFLLPKEPNTKVSHVFPSSNALPENLLRLYVRFPIDALSAAGVISLAKKAFRAAIASHAVL